MLRGKKDHRKKLKELDNKNFLKLSVLNEEFTRNNLNYGTIFFLQYCNKKVCVLTLGLHKEGILCILYTRQIYPLKTAILQKDDNTSWGKGPDCIT